MRILLSFILIFLLSNCRDMSPEEYKNTEPKIKIDPSIHYFPFKLTNTALLRTQTLPLNKEHLAKFGKIFS